MASIVNVTGPAELAFELSEMLDENLIAQDFVQQGAIHALSWLLSNGCTEERAAEMLASLRTNANLIRAESIRRGKPELFRHDQTVFQ